MSRKQAKTSQPDHSLKELIEAYRTIKLDIEARECAFKESLHPDKVALDILEGELLLELQTRGLKSCSVVSDDPRLSGTLYTSVRVSSKVEDAGVFFGYVIETGQTDLLFARAADKAVQAFIEEHKEPPPGVVVSETQKLNFRKKS